MKIAIIGSRSIKNIKIENYISNDCSEIVSGGAIGVDTCAADYALKKSIKLTVFLPEYKKYGKAATIVRNKQIVEYSDKVIAFWDGGSKGTLSVIKHCKALGKPCEIIIQHQST